LRRKANSSIWRMKTMGFNKIFVLGAGAIGSVYGALLSKKNDVTLIGDDAHVNAVNSKGLLITGDMNEVFHVKADSDIRRIPEETLVILTTKAYDSSEAIRGVKALLRKDTAILILQNGLGNEEVVSRIAENRARILRGITTMAAEFREPGKIRFWPGETTIEWNEVAEKVAETFNENGLKTRLSHDINREIWNKLVANCVINPLTALFHVRNNEVGADSLKTVRHNIVEECVKVGKAEGIDLQAGLSEEIDREIAHYRNLSSMCQDVMKGKRTEIDFLNGKIVKLGRKHQIPTPVNETLTSLIKFLEEKNGVPRRD